MNEMRSLEDYVGRVRPTTASNIRLWVILGFVVIFEIEERHAPNVSMMNTVEESECIAANVAAVLGHDAIPPGGLICAGLSINPRLASG